MLSTSWTPAAQRAQKTDVERDDLVGAIASVEVSVALPSDPTRFETVERSSFDAAGWLVAKDYFVDGRVASHATFRNEKGLRRVASSTAEGFGYGIRPTRLQPRSDLGLPAQSADGTYPFVVERTFDTAGRLLAEAISAGSDPATTAAPLGRFLYRYDASGRLSEWTRYGGSSTVPLDKETLVYDEHDHVKEAIHYHQGNSMASKRSFSYEYDEHGNWTKRMTTEQLGGVPTVTVTLRKIVYR